MNSKVSLVIKLVLLAAIVFLGYKLYSIIQEPIRFEKLKEKRYTAIKQRLEHIRDAQKVFRTETDAFASNFDQLIAFVDTGKETIIERKDSSFTYYDKTYLKDMVKDTVVTRVLGFQSVKASLFGEDFDSDQLRYIPGTEDEFVMDAKKINVNDMVTPVFEAYAADTVIFADVYGRYEQFIENHHKLAVGSLTEPSLSGNWR